MTIQEYTELFLGQMQETTFLEAVAVVFGVVSVVLANRNNMLLYPTGIISTALYVYIMMSVGLYAETLLNGYYLIMSVYGWLRWSNNKENMNATAITQNNAKDWMVTAGIVVGGYVLLYMVLRYYTDSTVPVLDAIVTSFAWAGMWLLAKHKIENWILLNISNAIAIPLLIYKGIPLTAVLTLILFVVAVFGYFRWRKLYCLQHE
ncbi:MAG: nicotinamide mononucleotide transporter [Chitinophagales bacterium]|nr:nicotinamide mononucleotide transporter [Chitinophagales bacterium]